MTTQFDRNADFIDQAVDIVSAYVSNNSIATAHLPDLIVKVYDALRNLDGWNSDPQPEPLKPAVPVRRSIFPDYIICLEDGRKYKSLKRHLGSRYNLSPAAYREKWRLPPDYPMVAPNYAEARSNLAKAMGLGQQRKKSVATKASQGGKKASSTPKSRFQ